MSLQLWKLKNGQVINLIHIDKFKEILDGTLLYDIFGNKYIKGKDFIDNDTRGGYLAFGQLIENHQEKKEQNAQS